MLLLHETGSKLAIYIMEKAILLPVLLILALHYLGVQSLRVCDQFPAGLDDALREDFEHDKVHAADKDHPALRKGHAETEYFRRAFCQECICSGCYYGSDSGPLFVTRIKKLNKAHEQLRVAAGNAQVIIQYHHPWDVGCSLHPSLDTASDPCLLFQNNYVIMYSIRWHLPIYVSYHLPAEHVLAGEKADRKDCFRRDIRLDPTQEESAMCAYYEKKYHNSQYLRGHMAPSADMRHDPLAELNACILSNVAPTTETFEDTVWGPMEDKAREWAKAHGTVFVISGTLLDNIAKPRWIKSPRDVAVPDRLFKVIIRCTTAKVQHILTCPNQGLDAIVFIHPNTPNTEKQKVKGELNEYKAKALEELLCINFIQHLPKEEQKALEKGLSGKSGVKTLVGNYFVYRLSDLQSDVIQSIADKGLDQMKQILGGEGFAECNTPDHVIKGQVSKGRPKALSALVNVFGCYVFSSTHWTGEQGKELNLAELAADISSEAQTMGLVHYLEVNGNLVSLDALRYETKINFFPTIPIPNAQFYTPNMDLQAVLPRLKLELQQVVDNTIQALSKGLSVHDGL